MSTLINHEGETDSTLQEINITLFIDSDEIVRFTRWIGLVSTAVTSVSVFKPSEARATCGNMKHDISDMRQEHTHPDRHTHTHTHTHTSTYSSFLNFPLM